MICCCITNPTLLLVLSCFFPSPLPKINLLPPQFSFKLAFDWWTFGAPHFGTLERCFFGPKITFEGIEAFFLTTRGGPPMYRPHLFPLLAPEGVSPHVPAATFWRNLPAFAKKEEASPNISDWVPFSSPPIFACTHTHAQAHRHQHNHKSASCRLMRSRAVVEGRRPRVLAQAQSKGTIPKQLQPSNFGPAVSLVLVRCMRL